MISSFQNHSQSLSTSVESGISLNVTLLTVFRRLCAHLGGSNRWFPRSVEWSFRCPFEGWKYVFYGHTNGNYKRNCVFRFDNSETFKPVFSAIKKFTKKVVQQSHNIVFVLCDCWTTFLINFLISEQTGLKVDSISFKSQPKNKFLKGSFQKIGFEWLKLCEWFWRVQKIFWSFILKNKAALRLISRFPGYLSPTSPKVSSSASS